MSNEYADATEPRPTGELSSELAAAPAGRRSPLAELLWLSLPTVLQMLAYTVEQFTDTLMLSRVGDLHAAAAGNAGGVVFAVISFGFGVVMLVNALASTSFGERNFAECGRHLWQGLWFALGYSALVSPAIYAAGTIFRAMGHGPELVALEVSYFNVSIALIAAKMLAVVLGQFMVAINRPNVLVVATGVGVLSNVFVNWLLIYGHWGLPRLGVAGAAWGTNAAVLTELLIVSSVVFFGPVRATFATRDWRPDAGRLKLLLRTGLPSGFQFAGDVYAWNIFFGGVLAFYGTASLAASIYAIQYMKLAFMPAFGMSSAVTALVARSVAQGRADVARARADLGFVVAATYMLACGIAFWLLAGPLMRWFTDDAEVIRVGRTVLAFCAIFQLLDAMFIVYNGALRGVRDTFVPACVQIGLVWLLLVGGGTTVARLRPGWGIAAPWTVGVVYVAILSAFLMIRFRRGRWEREASPSPAATPS